MTRPGVQWAIATGGRGEFAWQTLPLPLHVVRPGATVITRNEVGHMQPDPDLFLAAADRLGADIHASVVVGDSVWSCSRRGVPTPWASSCSQVAVAGMNSNRVYQDPRDLLEHLDKHGVRSLK